MIPTSWSLQKTKNNNVHLKKGVFTTLGLFLFVCLFFIHLTLPKTRVSLRNKCFSGVGRFNLKSEAYYEYT